jgi:hypothetical protein
VVSLEIEEIRAVAEVLRMLIISPEQRTLGLMKNINYYRRILRQDEENWKGRGPLLGCEVRCVEVGERGMDDE